MGPDPHRLGGAREWRGAEDFGEGPHARLVSSRHRRTRPRISNWKRVSISLCDSGRTALAPVGGDYDLLLTQRLVLQPDAELNFYGKRRSGASSSARDFRISS